MKNPQIGYVKDFRIYISKFGIRFQAFSEANLESIDLVYEKNSSK